MSFTLLLFTSQRIIIIIHRNLFEDAAAVVLRLSLILGTYIYDIETTRHLVCVCVCRDSSDTFVHHPGVLCTLCAV